MSGAEGLGEAVEIGRRVLRERFPDGGGAAILLDLLEGALDGRFGGPAPFHDLQSVFTIETAPADGVGDGFALHLIQATQMPGGLGELRAVGALQSGGGLDGAMPFVFNGLHFGDAGGARDGHALAGLGLKEGSVSPAFEGSKTGGEGAEALQTAETTDGANADQGLQAFA